MIVGASTHGAMMVGPWSLVKGHATTNGTWHSVYHPEEGWGLAFVGDDEGFGIPLVEIRSVRKAARGLNVVLDLEVNDPTDPVGRQWLVAIGPGRAMSKVFAAMGVHDLKHWVNPQPHEWSLAEVLPALSEPEDATATVEAGPA